MGAAIGWGALAASSLVIGAAVGLARPWPRKLVGLVLGFGAGALISAVSFELVQEGVRQARGLPVAIGLAVGALTYFVAAGRVAAMGGGGALALGAFLDGIPEQMVLGIGLASGEPVERRAPGRDLRLEPARGHRRRDRHEARDALQQARDAQLALDRRLLRAGDAGRLRGSRTSPRTSCRPASTASPPAP